MTTFSFISSFGVINIIAVVTWTISLFFFFLIFYKTMQHKNQKNKNKKTATQVTPSEDKG
uniref:Uncharacterized protein n=1 Tax=Anguilla anguilla TaxID=7936 RepID=A0A0E9WTZ7_ANGAN